ncbi:thermonuclease family protein [Alteriqipengyuania sp. NZ-12B]|uniref:Thermonuclease family protein n=1 Tax=Alteriqipengyuania abyssalis TaxID=2860200 RepID=A0ABS7PFS8_9SPHN|nr:thermonuclease family protein [Alteriqipengyuania abyssalis]MBY8337921.1 thermonuclease family protein [Alteriqipengyuania abyssalis]
MLSLAAALLAFIQVDAERVQFTICGSERRVTCVVDGDTFWLHRVKYRVADIDAPEVSQPECEREALLGDAATLRLVQLLNDGAFSLTTHGKDRYGRTLATVSRSSISLGESLVNEGLARRWGDRRGWC